LKVKQQTLQSFEFILDNGDKESFFSYIKQNEPLLKGYTIIINGKGDISEIKEFLEERNFCFFIRDCELTTRKKSVIPLSNLSVEDALKTIKKNEEKSDNKNRNNRSRIREVIEKPVRSGSSIQTSNDVTILSQVNSGSEINVSGNLEIFGTINGRIECGGSYMLLRDIGENGLVIFNGVILEKERFKSKKAKLLKLDNDKKLIIEEL